MTDEELMQLQLISMPHAQLYQLREKLPKSQQALIAPYEHRAFAREVVQENPWMAAPVVAGTLAYQPYKALFGARSAPSLKQVAESFKGIYEGLFTPTPKE